MYGSAILPLILIAQLGVEGSPQPVPTPPECIGCRVDLAAIRATYTEAQWQAMQRGEVVVTIATGTQSGAGSHNEASAIIPYPPAPVWGVVTDFESRPRFVPGNKEVRILRREGNRLWIAEHLRILLINVRFVVISTLVPEEGRVTWVLDREAEHDIADTTGSWTVVPLDGEQATLVRYQAWVDSGRSVPRFVEEFLIERSLPEIVEGIRTEVQRRYPGLRAAPPERPAD